MLWFENDCLFLIERIYEEFYVEEEEEEMVYDEVEKVYIVSDDERDFEYGVGCGGVLLFFWRKLWLFIGFGFLMSIVFFDLGNFEGDF